MGELLPTDELCVAIQWTDSAGNRHQRQVTAEQTLVVGPGPAVDLHLPPGADLPQAHALLLPTAAGILLRPQAALRLLLRHQAQENVHEVSVPTLIAEGAQVCLRAGSATLFLTLGRRPRRAPAQAPAFPAPILRAQEPLFRGTLGIFSAAALLFCGAIARADRPVDLPMLEDEVIASLPVQVFRIPPVKPAQAIPVQQRPKRVQKAAPAAAAPEAAPAGSPRSTVLSVLGTHGPSSERWSAVMAPDAELEAALQEVQAPSLASQEHEVRRPEGAGVQAERGIGQIGLHGGGLATIRETAASQPPPREVQLHAQLELSGDLEESLRLGLRQGAASVKRCYEAAIKTNPDLAGRLEVTISVRAGRVSSASADGDEPALNEIASCVARAARGWRFDEGVSAEEVLVPFVLALQ